MFDSERKAIETWFGDKFAAVEPTVLIAFEDVPFPPEDVQPPDEYVELHILSGAGQKLEIGTVAAKRWVGVIQVTVRTQAGNGSGRSKQIADRVAEIWDGAYFLSGLYEEIQCFTPDVRTIGVIDGELTAVVSVEFWRTLVTPTQGVTMPKPKLYDLIGQQDGINQDFSIPAQPQDPASVLIFFNTNTLSSPADFTIDGVNIHFINLVPISDDLIKAYY